MASMTLEQFTTRAREALGDALRAVVLYGSQVAPGATVHGSDYNLLLLVARAGHGELAALAPVVRDWRASGQPAPMTMTSEEWTRCADVFPIEVADILWRHRVLHGTLPTEGLEVAPADLRQQLEHDARGAVLQLRAGRLATGGRPDEQVSLLGHSVSGFATMTRALLRLSGAPIPATKAEMIPAAARIAGFDPGPVLVAIAAKRGERPADPAAALEAFAVQVERLVAFLDGWTPPAP